MSSKYIKKHTIPEGFPEILTEFTKEILRNQPLDLIDFGCEYFKCLEEGLILDYPHRGQKIPCDFKVFVPKIPSSVKRNYFEDDNKKYTEENKLRIPINGERMPRDSGERIPTNKKFDKTDDTEEINLVAHKDVVIDEVNDEKEGENILMEGGGVMIDEVDEEENVLMEGGGVMIDEVDEEENVLMEGGGVMIDEVDEEENVLMEGGGVMIDEVDEEENVLMEGGGVMIDEVNEEDNVLMEGGGVMIDEVDEEERVELNEKDGVDQIQERLLATGSNINEINLSTPPHTLTDFKLDFYENCIDFPDKESQLESLKQDNEESVNAYIEKVFLPNKNLNDLLIEIQNALMCYYENKGTENESKFNEMDKSIRDKLNEMNLPILQSDYKSKELNDAINDFKSFDYYPRATQCYMIKLDNPPEENNQYLDEFCFFLLNHKLKDLVERDDAKDIIEKYPYIKKYFDRNIELLEPEIYSFVLNSKYYPEDEFCNNFSTFSVRKRELCQNYYKLHNINNEDKEVSKCIANMENCHFISSPSQINAKLDSINSENEDEINITVTEKLQKNYSKMWNFISRVTNTPIELIEQSYYDFMSYKPIERDIILKYLALNPDFSDIQHKLSEVKINPDDSNFYHKMKELNMEIEHSPELNYRNLCIYRNKLFDIPENTKNYIDKIENNEESLNDEELFKEYMNLSPLSKDGIYYYLLIKNKEDNRVSNLLKEIEIEKLKREAESYKNRGKTLIENFTNDSDEFVAYNKEYNNWKNNNAKNLNEFFNSDDKDDYFNNKLNDEEQKVIVDMLQIENIIDEEYPLKDKIKEFKKIVKEKKKSSGNYEGIESDTDKGFEDEEDYVEREEQD